VIHFSPFSIENITNQNNSICLKYASSAAFLKVQAILVATFYLWLRHCLRERLYWAWSTDSFH